MDRKEARSFLTLYSYRPLDSRRIWSDATEHSDTRARLNLIKPDKFSNSGRAAPILIRAMNINSRRWLTWTRYVRSHSRSSRFFSFSPKNRRLLDQMSEISFRFVSYISILRDSPSRGGWKLDPSFIFYSFSFSSPIVNSLILDRASFESRLSTIPGHRVEPIQFGRNRSKIPGRRGEGRECVARRLIKREVPLQSSLLSSPHPTRF